jgi:hypothetical protein
MGWASMFLQVSKNRTAHTAVLKVDNLDMAVIIGYYKVNVLRDIL